MLTKNEANELYKEFEGIYVYRPDCPGCLKTHEIWEKLTTKIKKFTVASIPEDNTKKALQIVIDVLGYMADEYRSRHYHKFNVGNSLKTAEEILGVRNVD